jgi:hypothetical protein
MIQSYATFAGMNQVLSEADGHEYEQQLAGGFDD